MMEKTTSIQPIIFSNNSWKDGNIPPPEENSATLSVNSEIWLSFRCSPSLLKELAIGFLFNEHIIKSVSEVEIVKVCENNKNIDVWLNHDAKKPDTWENTSGCTGGKTSMRNKEEIISFDENQIEPQLILDLYTLLISKQEEYRRTRGVHCSLLSDGEDYYLVAEDIGRHNTIDKIAGLLLLDSKQDWKQKIILTTGRISSEMIQKSARLGASIVVSRTSPTKWSVEYANEHNITLIGYTRRNEFTLYANPQRIKI